MLASSIAIIVWCSETFCPLNRPLTASLEAACLAETSLIRPVTSLSKPTGAVLVTPIGFGRMPGESFSSSVNGMTFGAADSEIVCTGASVRKAGYARVRSADSGFISPGSQWLPFANGESLQRHAARGFHRVQIGFVGAGRRHQIHHFLVDVDVRHRDHAIRVGIGVAGLIDQAGLSAGRFDLRDPD